MIPLSPIFVALGSSVVAKIAIKQHLALGSLNDPNRVTEVVHNQTAFIVAPFSAAEGEVEQCLGQASPQWASHLYAIILHASCTVFVVTTAREGRGTRVTH